MSLLHRVIHRLKKDYFRAQYEKAVGQIRSTAPLKRGDLPFAVLSMVHKRDVDSYLVAVKSFCHFANPERIVIVCDPSISDEDRKVFSAHIPHVELRHADEFVHPDIPRGGCWERLFAITDIVKDTYVVQLDADTLTVKPIPEVLEGVKNGTGFVLGETPDTPARLLGAVRENALQWIGPGAHIQAIAEVEMVNVGLPEDARYIRGCAGFTGFPRSADLRSKLIDYSRRMRDKIGNDWTRWGTEQVSSNYLVSNTPGVKALPFPEYGTPDHATSKTVFYHFIGSLRFVNSKYEKTSRQVIHMITSAAT